MSNDHNRNEELNEEEREKLRLENEILKLKMQAEFGAMFGETGAELTPEMEHAFLQNILAFEEQYQNRKMVKVYDLLGQPAYKPFAELGVDEVKPELKRLLLLMQEKNVLLHVKTKYPAELIYQFITEELFEHETDDMEVEGMSKNFSYEEFHPNHKADIEEGMMEFLKHWFEQSFDENSMILSEQMILPDGPVPSLILKSDVLYKLQLFFDSYRKFEDCRFAVMDIAFQWDDVQSKGMGHAEGGVKYNAVLESGEEQFIEGAFKIYFSNEFGKWQVMYFVFPGFNW